MKVVCARCKRPTDAPINLKQPQTVNLLAVSLVIMEHAEQFVCEHCGAVLVPGIANANLVLATVEVPKQAEKPVIIVPGRA